MWQLVYKRVLMYLLNITSLQWRFSANAVLVCECSLQNPIVADLLCKIPASEVGQKEVSDVWFLEECTGRVHGFCNGRSTKHVPSMYDQVRIYLIYNLFECIVCHHENFWKLDKDINSIPESLTGHLSLRHLDVLSSGMSVGNLSGSLLPQSSVSEGNMQRLVWSRSQCTPPRPSLWHVTPENSLWLSHLHVNVRILLSKDILGWVWLHFFPNGKQVSEGVSLFHSQVVGCNQGKRACVPLWCLPWWFLFWSHCGR